MLQVLRRASALFVLPLLIATAGSAQTYSVSAGGAWNSGATWQGGAVPGANDHVVIRGTVSVDNTTTVAQLTVESGATLQIQPGGDRTLTVTGGLTNNGTIRDRHDGNWWLYLAIGGSITNNGTWGNYRTTINGSVDQSMSQAAGTTFNSPITVDKSAGTIVAGSNLRFAQVFNLNGNTIQMNGWTLGFQESGYTTGGMVFTQGALYQTNVTRSAAEYTRFIGTTTIQGRVNLGPDNVFEGTLIVADTLQNTAGDVTNYVEGAIINNGTIRDRYFGNWWLYLRMYGDITNNGVWTNYRSYLVGTGDQTMTHGTGSTFASPLESLKESGTTLAGSHLDFSEWFDMNQDPLAMGSWTLRFRGNGYLNEGLVTTDGALEQVASTRAAIEYSRFVGTTTLRGDFYMGRDNVFEGTLIVADTLQNVAGCDCNTYVEGDIINNGTIRNRKNNNYWLYLRIHGDLANYGTWTNYRTYLIGIGDQTMTHGSGTTFASPLESLKETGHIHAGSNLDFSNWMDLNQDSLYTGTYGITVRDGGNVYESNVFMDGFFHQTGSVASGMDYSRFVGTTRLREKVVLGRNNRFAGTVVVEDTLQNVNGCDCTATIEGAIINNGVIRDRVYGNWWFYMNLQGSVTNNGTWTNYHNYLNGNGMRTWNAPNVTAPMTMNEGNVTLSGTNVMSRLDISAAKGPHVASGASFQVPPNSSAKLTNDGRVYLMQEVSGGGTFGLYHSDFRVAAGAFDSLEVSHHGNQAPGTFSNAVRSHWTIRRVPENASGSLEWMTFGYTDAELGNNVEANLQVYHSADNGFSWQQISSSGNTERNLEANTIKVTTVPSSGILALSSDPDRITLLPSVITSVIGRDQIRLGPPNRYTVHYANNSDVSTGDMFLMLHVNRNIHINHIEPSAPEGVDADWLYPEDFAIYTDSTVAPPDTVAILLVQSMAPHEERSFDVVLDAYPDGYNPGKRIIFAPAVIVVVKWAAVGLATSYATDMTFNVVEESFARTDGAGPVISTAWRKTNEKWFSFEKPATELVKDLAFTWGQAIIGGTLGSATVMAIKVGEGLFNFLKAVACGSDRYLNDRQTIAACIEKPVEKVTSWDPNEKIGPSGFGELGFVTDATRMTYQILFENKAEAGAPAWKIVIDDTLSTAFDASSVRFEGASHEGFDFSVNGQVLHWEITGIDLPPNVAPPEGEGYVSFSVNTVPGLPSGTVLANRAVIVFDFNEPIMTNTFVNTLDFEAPVTTMRALPASVTGGDLTVRWDVADGVGGSGVQSTDLFVSVDGGGFQSVGSTTADSMQVSLEPNHEYRFYALSKDQVGNGEIVRSGVVSTQVMSGVFTEDGALPFEFRLDAAYPNPFNPITTLGYTLPVSGQARLEIFDSVGRRVAVLVDSDQLPGTHTVRWDASGQASGVYFYRLTQGARIQTRPMVLLK